MKTAVEQLEKQILDNWMGILTGKVNIGDFFEQAKEMEKEQIINAHFNGCETGEMFNNHENRAFITDAEKYYNETFKQQEQ